MAAATNLIFLFYAIEATKVKKKLLRRKKLRPARIPPQATSSVDKPLRSG
jgi:hypothetical protein